MSSEVSKATITLSSTSSGAIPSVKPSIIGNGVVANGVSRNGSTTTIRKTTYESGSTFAVGSSNTVKLFNDATERERKEMQELNDRLGNYIARVKLLEQQNKDLVAALGDLRGRWGTKNDKLKTRVSEQVVITRNERNAAIRSKTAAEVQLQRTRDDLLEYKTRIDEAKLLTEADRARIPKLRADIQHAENELTRLGKMYDLVKKEEAALLNENSRLWNDLFDLRKQLDGLKTDRISAQAEVQAIKDELLFLKKVHDEEIKELQALLIVAPADTKEFFRNEIALAIRDIRKEYDLLAATKKTELQSWYTIKVNELQALQDRRANDKVLHSQMVTKLNKTMTDLSAKYASMEGRNAQLEKEVAQLQHQVGDDLHQYELELERLDDMHKKLREECAILVAELQSLLSTKQELDTEIAIYRAMVEGEERRVGVVTAVKKVELAEEHSNQWDVTTKTHFQTTAHGHIAIVQCEPTGRFIVIENTSKITDERLDGWQIIRLLDSSRQVKFTFPEQTILGSSQKLKIIARDQGAVVPGVIVFQGEPTWGMGASVVTTLYNQFGEEKAVYTQKTVVG